MIIENVLNVGEIKKVNTSYGNYAFNYTAICKMGIHKIKRELTIYEFGLKTIKELRNKKLNEVKK